MWPRRVGNAAVAVMLLLAATSCGDDSSTDTTDTTSGGSTSTSTSTSSADSTTTSSSVDVLEDATPDDKEGGVETGPVALVTAVRIGSHEGYERVVFEFRDRVPAWWVNAEEGDLMGDPTGEPISIEGSRWLRVRMAPSSGVEFTDEDPGYIEVYQGPDRVEGSGGVVTEAVLIGDFEANLQWAIVVSEPVDYRVLELTDPPRLVIDARPS